MSSASSADTAGGSSDPAGVHATTVPGDAIRVACLGDSNTVGGGLGKTGAYPAQLQSMLDASSGRGMFSVKGFGVNGATAADTQGKKCYWKQERFKDACEFQAHIYVMMLGTNDAWHRTGEPGKVAEGIQYGILSILESFGPLVTATELPGTAKDISRLLIVLPPGAKAGRLVENLSAIVHPSLRQFVQSWRQTSAPVPESLKPVLVEPSLPVESAYRPDMVHLTRAGAEAVAAAIAKKIKDSDG
eukprot:TRINITY_DN15925_c0_g1_i1.p1 TRINITY_DN15925_c0_g1~~TRINITY_DN15925_c0_g1_i1.p1  ORF type:complete len:245 (-),score=51.81 TRINITY_DN15925_c0_g1_i1:69-803(-)